MTARTRMAPIADEIDALGWWADAAQVLADYADADAGPDRADVLADAKDLLRAMRAAAEAEDGVWLYRAALYCGPCGAKLPACPAADCDDREAAGGCHDSDQYRKGPFLDGGGEADYAVHCDQCRIGLGNVVIGASE